MSDAVMVPREITMRMRHFAWKQEYLDNGATEAEASVLAANRETDPEEVEGARSAYRAMLAASPSVGGWEDISTAPRDLVVQMYEPHSQGGFMFAGCIGIDGSYRDNLRGDALNPTHWMPLPQPPSVSTGSRPQTGKGS